MIKKSLFALLKLAAAISILTACTASNEEFSSNVKEMIKKEAGEDAFVSSAWFFGDGAIYCGQFNLKRKFFANRDGEFLIDKDAEEKYSLTCGTVDLDGVAASCVAESVGKCKSACNRDPVNSFCTFKHLNNPESIIGSGCKKEIESIDYGNRAEKCIQEACASVKIAVSGDCFDKALAAQRKK